MGWAGVPVEVRVEALEEVPLREHARLRICCLEAVLEAHVLVPPGIRVARLLQQREDERQVSDGRIVRRTMRVLRRDHDTVTRPKQLIRFGACALLDGRKELGQIT